MIYFLQHIDIEGPGLLEDFFSQKVSQTETIHLYANESLPSLTNSDAVVILGGPMNVYEEEKYLFLEKENKFIQDALERRIPLLGICLGAQLIAKAAGAQVTRARKEEIGWSPVRFTEEGMRDPLFEGIGDVMEVFQWHHDTFAIPSQGILLATTEICNQSFRIGNAYALQFHVEIKPKMITEWIKEYIHRDRWNNAQYALMINHAHVIEKNYFMNAQRIFLNFSRMITERISIQ